MNIPMLFGSRSFANAMLHLLLGCLLVLSSSFSSGDEFATNVVSRFGSKSSITFAGTCSGGALVLSPTPRRNGVHYGIKTAPGETAPVVAARLASALNALPGDLAGTVIVSSNTITLPGRFGHYILGGTEQGLGIPPPPTSLSARYDFQNNRVSLNWDNPSTSYDSIAVVCDGSLMAKLPGSSRTFTQRLGWLGQFDNPNDADFCVLGLRGGVPSNAGGIHLAGERQEELVNIPFTLGVAPNWCCWSNGVQKSSLIFVQGTKHEVLENGFFTNPSKKPYFQILGGSGAMFVGGTWRQFSDLTPGATYRVFVRINTLEMRAGTNWNFSVHAAYNNMTNSAFTSEQLAGTSPLPDGSVGGEAGRLLAYGESRTTGGEWVEISTRMSAGKGLGSDITLPRDVNGITLWTRLVGSNTCVSGVGVDWFAIEKVSHPKMLKSKGLTVENSAR